MDLENSFSARKYPEIQNFSVINQNTLGFSKNDAIGFVNIENGHVKFHHVIDEKVKDVGISGISCISGHKSEPIYAIGDISTPPRIILFTYPNECIGQLSNNNYNTEIFWLNNFF